MSSSKISKKKKKKKVVAKEKSKDERKKDTKRKIRVRIAKTTSSKKVLSVAKQPVIAIVQESSDKRKPKRKSRASAPLPHPLLLKQNTKKKRKKKSAETKKNAETKKKKKKRKSESTAEETKTKKKKLKPNSDEWILKQNPFFLSAEQRERRAQILKKRKEEKKQSAVKRLREKEKETQKHDQVLKETFGRVDNPFFANVGSAIRRQAKRQKMKALTVDLSGESEVDSKRNWRLSLFPEDSSLIQLPPHLTPSSDFVITKRVTPHQLSVPLTISEPVRKILCPSESDDVSTTQQHPTPFKSSSVSVLASQIKSMFFQQQEEDTDRDMEIETLTSTLLQNAKRLYDNSSNEHAIWTRKYASQKPSELLGSVTNRITNQMCEWLELWQKRFTEERRLERKRLKNRLRQSFFLDRDSEAYMEAACNKRVSTGHLLEGPVGSGKSIVVRSVRAWSSSNITLSIYFNHFTFSCFQLRHSN